MPTSSLISRLFNEANSGYFFLFAVGVFGAVRSCFVDVFSDESDTPLPEAERERYGLKATKVTRPLMVIAFLLIAGFAVWKMLQPK